MRGLKTLVLAASALALIGGSALAGPQFVRDGHALGGYDAVGYFTEGQPVKGSDDFTHTYNGATWLFASAENRDRFAADPAAYAPAFDGHCAYGVALRGKVPGDPAVWDIVDGILYVNVNRQVQDWWRADVPGFITKAEANWPALAPQPAAVDRNR